MTAEISNSEDVIDSRDVIARIDDLESERQDLVAAIDNAKADVEDDDSPVRSAETDLEVWDDENGDELKALKALAEEVEGYAEDWNYGASLVRDSYFVEYAQQLADDIGAINKDARWPNDCIDWDKAAGELQQDYTSVDFDGVTYWVR